VSIVDSTLVTARLSELRTQPRAILSRKELQVALMLAVGRSRPAVATELGLSANTVGTYTKRIYSKLCVRNRAEFTARMKSAWVLSDGSPKPKV
jgi:DNA-binding NarL/FixJ family response regulator